MNPGVIKLLGFLNDLTIIKEVGTQLINLAKAEGRDLTDAEVNSVYNEALIARAAYLLAKAKRLGTA